MMYHFLTLLSYLPLSLLYASSSVLYWVIYYLIGYRRAVVHANIRRAFPQWQEAQIDAISRLTYRRLAEVLVEIIKLPRLSAHEIKQRVHLVNIEELTWESRPVIIVGAHQGNWEWLLQRMVLEKPHPVYGIYKPLHNSGANRFMQENRARFGAAMVPYKDFARWSLRQQDQTCIMMGDQAPASRKGVMSVQFFGQDTSFYSSLARLSARRGLPVFYVSMQRVRQGSYQARFEPLGVADETQQEAFMRRYTEKIEQAVRMQPEGWLWTHRRWKDKTPR